MLIVGIDEVGRGCLAGPVVAAACLLPTGYENEQIKDSKKIAFKKRVILDETIRYHAIAIGIGVVCNAIIDKINILQATKQAMHLALNNLTNLKPNNNINFNSNSDYNIDDLNSTIIHYGSNGESNDSEIDNHWLGYKSCNTVIHYDKIIIDSVKLNNIHTPMLSENKADDKYISVSAASIIAKVYRDRLMINLSKIYPEYGFERNFGYGTKIHTEAIKKYGFLPIHRLSFLKKF